MTQGTNLSVAYYLEASFADTMKQVGLNQMKVGRDNQVAARWRWTIEWFSIEKGRPLRVRAAALEEAIDKAIDLAKETRLEVGDDTE